MILEIMDDVGAAERLQDFFGDVTYNNEYSQMLALHFTATTVLVGSFAAKWLAEGSEGPF